MLWRDAQAFSGGESMEIERWRLRIYVIGFLVAVGLYGLVHGIGRGGWFWGVLIASAAAVIYGGWTEHGRFLRIGCIVLVVLSLAVPLLDDMVAHGHSAAIAVADVTVWPQMLVALLGSRVLASECELSFVAFWRGPAYRDPSVAMQSIASAFALGGFLTLLFYLVIPRALPLEVGQPSAILVSAMQGGTIVHTTIILLFFVIVAVICDAVRLHIADWAVLRQFRASLAATAAQGAQVDARIAARAVLKSAPQTRAARLLADAVELLTGSSTERASLATLSLEGFRDASRRFIRTLLPFLPLLGFLGTVIGLATAIAELPHGLAESGARSFDVSGSLAGLAIKFETTLLGLLASMISSLALNLLEKREAEFAAACLRAVETAIPQQKGGLDA